MTDPAIDGGAEPSVSQSDLATMGARLAAARESLGLSVADVARQIKLSVRQVQALEADDLTHLPKSPVIVKGFLRNYARLVQLDPDKLLASLHATPGADGKVERRNRRREVVSFDRPSRLWLKVLLGGSLIVAILLGAYEYHMNPDFFSKPAAPEATNRSTPVPRPAASGTPASNATEEASPPLAAATAAVEGQGAAAGPSSIDGAATGTPASAPGVVRFRFQRDAWIEIKDRDGNRIVNQLGKAGTEKAVEGPPPLKLVIGAASGVKAEWNGQPVDLVPFTKVDVARLTLE
jgi:cytoskeleton protein RodZ